MPRRFDDPATAFWDRVDKSGGTEACWPWLLFRTKRGYGIFKCRALPKYRCANRAAYFFTHGEFDLALDVCHSCDNPSCCNPAHLWLGTRRANIHDCIAKGRFSWPPRGTWNRKITPEQRQEIKRRYAAGERGVDLAPLFGLSPQTIYNIANGWHDGYGTS